MKKMCSVLSKACEESCTSLMTSSFLKGSHHTSKWMANNASACNFLALALKKLQI